MRLQFVILITVGLKEVVRLLHDQNMTCDVGLLRP